MKNFIKKLLYLIAIILPCIVSNPLLGNSGNDYCSQCCKNGRAVSRECCKNCQNCCMYNDEACAECKDFY